MKQPTPARQHVSRAKTRIAHWSDIVSYPSAIRAALLRGMDGIHRELPEREAWAEVLTVELDGGGGLPIRIDEDRWRVTPSKHHLAVSTVLPAWGFGWHKVFKTPEVYDTLSWFLHYARQYVHRSIVARVLMIAWENHGTILHPFGSNTTLQRYGPVIPMKSLHQALDTAEQHIVAQWSEAKDDCEPTTSKWIHRNTVDPFIHQAVFHHLRGESLRREGFGVEAVVAFYCTLQAASGLIQTRHGLAYVPSHADVCRLLALPPESAGLADYAYFLRNNFSAHAGGWRWWDQDEIADEDTQGEIAALSSSVLAGAADIEPSIRTVDPNPGSWADWFFENFDTLWDAVWFEKLHAFENAKQKQPESQA